MNLIKNFIKQNLIIISILIMSGFLLSININKKFIGIHDWNGVWYGSIARNQLRYGLINLKFGSIKGSGPIEIKNSSFFTHYPLLFPLILNGAFHIFGVSELSLRLTISFFSILSILFIYLISLQLFNKTTALLSSLFTCIIPLFVYYGKMPVHEPVIMAFILASFYFYVKWFFFQSLINYILCSIFIIFALLITWPAYFLLVLYPLHYLLFHPKKKHKKLLISFFFIGSTTIMFHLFHVFILTGSFLGGGIINIFTSRINSVSTNELYSLNLQKYFITEIRYLSIYFTKILSILCFIWLTLGLIDIIKFKKIRIHNSFLWLLMIFGSLYLIIFKEAAFLHDYLIYYLLPFFVITSAYIFNKFLTIFHNIFLRYLLIFIFTIIIGLEGGNYIKALNRSNQSEKAYIIGNFINKHSQFQDKIFIGSNFYGQFYEPFINYYSDRIVDYGEILNNTEINNYKIIIRPKAHDALEIKSKEFLNSHFKFYEDTNFIWYDTSVKI